MTYPQNYATINLGWVSSNNNGVSTMLLWGVQLAMVCSYGVSNLISRAFQKVGGFS